MSNSESRPRIRANVSSPRELLEAVPYLLGFRPQESIVIITLRGAERRIGLTARVDRSAVEGMHGREAASDLARLALRDGGSAAVVVGYADDQHEPAGREAGRAAHLAFCAALREAEIEFYDSLHVCGGTWWSLLRDDGSCGPPSSGPVPRVSGGRAGSPVGAGGLAFAAALNGMAPLPSREALVDSLRPAHAVARAELAQAVDRRLSAFLADRTRAVDKTAFDAAARRETLRLAGSSAQCVSDGPIRLSTDVMAHLLVGMTDPTARDLCLEWSARDETGTVMRLWTHLARLAPAPLDAIPLTLLAWCSYRRGNGAFAGIALERALASDPGYRLAQILLGALDRAVEPQTLRAIEQELGPLLRNQESAPGRFEPWKTDGTRVRRSRRRNAR